MNLTLTLSTLPPRQRHAMLVLGVAGAFIGSHVGVAALGSAVAGTLPGAAIGMLVGAALF